MGGVCAGHCIRETSQYDMMSLILLLVLKSCVLIIDNGSLGGITLKLIKI